MELINHLFEGVDKDTALKLFKATRARHMHNFRLVDIGGNAFEATNIPGNGYDQVSLLGFKLTEGFKPLGYDTLNGISYILSRHDDGRVEIGSFPSPDYNAGTGFVRRYQPLQNWTGAVNHYAFEYAGGDPATVSSDFQTSLFEMECKRIRVKCREDYDGSVNVYYTDNQNPLRVINSGFHQRTGARNGRYYNLLSFPQVINLNNETILPPAVDLLDIKTNGILGTGNWHAHFRYVTDSLDPTSFNTELGPVQISPSNERLEPFRTHGGSPETVTNKSIVLQVDVTTLDQSYKYMEIAMVRRFSDESIEVKIVNRLFEIQEMIALNGATFDIEITGKELTIDATTADIITRKRTDDICRDIEMIDLYLLGANTTEREWYNDDLKNFAASIQAQYDDSQVLVDDYPDTIFGGATSVSGIPLSDVLYKNFQNTFRYTGYFRSEPYIFGVMFLMKKTGILTPAFPVKGYDHINPTGAPDPTNPNGIVRFPGNNTNPYKVNDNCSIMGVKFTVNGANVTSWIRDNVAGMYFVRSERRPNLLYQGLLLQCFNSYNPGSPVVDCNGKYFVPNGLHGEPGFWTKTRNDSSNQRCAPFMEIFNSGNTLPAPNDSHCPLQYRARLPWIVGYDDGAGGIVSGYGERLNPGDWTAPDKHIPKVAGQKHGLISPDFSFSLKSYDVTAFIESQGFWQGSTKIDNPIRLPIKEYWYDMSNLFQGAFFKKSYASIHGISQWQVPDNNKFVSYYNEGVGVEYNTTDDTVPENEVIDPYHFFYHFSQQRSDKKRTLVKNMAMGIISYLGINSKISVGGWVLGGYNPLDPTDHRMIANVYFTDPSSQSSADIQRYYNFRSETFFKISNFLPLPADEFTVDTHIAYKGDCFISRTYVKTLGNPIYTPDRTDDDFLGEVGQGLTTYGYGQAVGVTLECAFNACMRHSSGEIAENQDAETFYPEYEVDQPRNWIQGLKSREAFLFNRGYNKVLSINPHAAFDNTLPLQKRRYPNRIFYTDRHIVGSFADGWRRLGVAQHQDYDQRGGEIMAIMNNNSKLVVYCRHSIQLPSVNERALTTTADGGTLALGSQVEVLHPKIAFISEEFGLQNTFAVVRGLHGLYHVDVSRRKIGFIGGSQQIELLSDSKFIRTGFNDFIKTISDYSDVLVEIGDSPVCDEGFSLGYNKKYKEINFSLIHENIKKTIVYNELAQAFTWTVEYVSPFYITLNEDFYSVNPNDLDVFYLHDVEQLFGQPNYCKFYSAVNPSVCQLQIVVNKVPEETMIYENIRLSVNDEDLLQVTYDTEGQQAIHFPFRNNPERYIEPKYEEDFWEFPIKRADTGKNSHYTPGSEMRGNHILITFEWQTSRLIKVKSAVTNFKKSYH